MKSTRVGVWAAVGAISGGGMGFGSVVVVVCGGECEVGMGLSGGGEGVTVGVFGGVLVDDGRAW
jgi:hypothetical protein